MNARIEFYSTRETPYGIFSNFARSPFVLDGALWPTVEHCFQAHKFKGTPHFEQIQKAPTPKEAASMGRQRARPLREDWEDAKEEVMRQALRAKFEAHAAMMAVLIGTGDALIVEKTTGDHYWGCGSSGQGKNRLGYLLMELRDSVAAKQG